MAEKSKCQGCIDLVQKAKGNSVVGGLTAHQDRGGLMYPTKELVTLLISLKKYVDKILSHRQAIDRPLKAIVKRAVTISIYI